MFKEKNNKPSLMSKVIIPLLGLASLFSFPFSTDYSLFFLVILYVFFFIGNQGPVLLFSLFSFISITPFLLEAIQIKTTYYNQYYSSSYYDDVFFSYLLFLIIFHVFINGLNINLSSILNKYKKRDIYFKLCFFIQLFILLVGKTGETIISSGYGQINTLGISGLIPGISINEYYLIFLVITLFIYKPNKYIHLLNILFLIKNILYGGRVEALQIMFAYSIFLKINFKSVKTLLISFVLLISFQVIGTIRHLGLSLELISSTLSEVSIYNLGFFQGATSTFSEVIYSSSVMQGIINDNLISQSLRLEMVIQHFFSYIFPYSFLNEKADISLFSQSISMAGGGGLPSAYFYFIGGLPFVIMGSLIYVYIFRKMHESQNYIYNALGILMLITTPRWLLYNHVTFVKSSFYLFIIMFLFYKVKVKFNSTTNKL